MKTIFLTFAILLTFNVSITAQESDYAMIGKTVSYYLDGGTNNDFETLKKAFHETATMRFVRDGKFQSVNVIEFFQNVMKPGRKQNRKTRILSIDISGNVATAQLEIEYPTFSFIDHMGLLKIENEWLIVNKMYFRKQKTTTK